MTNLLCDCSVPRTRDRNTPQQCRRCGNRIDRAFDDEIGTEEKVGEIDWAFR